MSLALQLKPILRVSAIALSLTQVLPHATALEITPPEISWKGSARDWSRRYLKVLKKFEAEVCQKDDRETYTQLLKEFRSQAQYLPVLPGNVLDRTAIQKSLPLLRHKKKWIETTEKKLKSLSSIPSFSKYKDTIEKSIESILKKKKEIRFSKEKTKIPSLELQIKNEVLILKKTFFRMMKDFFFLQSYGFPVDHFRHRAQYEPIRNEEDFETKQLANAIYFKRKIFEDGTYFNGKRPDLYLRSTLDTIALKLERIERNNDFDEDLRFDFEWTLKQLEKYLSQSKEDIELRISDWKKRVQDQYSFYQRIIHFSSSQVRKEVQVMLTEKNINREKLKDFVHEKQKETYRFWAKQKQIYRALFTFDTILLHEVGPATHENYLDRKDVAQLVINRKNHSFFSKLDPAEDLYQKLVSSPAPLSSKLIKERPWLNTLFKAAEFSFTLYYIPSVSHTFCPSTSGYFNRIRKKNLSLALQLLKNPNSDLGILRFFSRVSMLGKIDMGPLWKKFRSIPERPGSRVRRSHRLEALINKRDFRYLYSFEDPEGKAYDVIKIDEKKYSVDLSGKKSHIYSHRNPHYFEFYQLKDPNRPLNRSD